MTRKLTAEQQMAARFANDTKDHELTVLHDDGLYRHLRMRAPKNSAYWYDIVTWPGTLAIRGDMDGYMFTRLTDMFEFFRGHRVNPHYWAEKTEGGRNSVMTYSEDVFREQVWAHVREYGHERRGLAKAVQAELFDTGYSSDEQSAREALDAFDHEGFRFEDTWEWSFRDYDWTFLWACHAVRTGIIAYDRAKIEQPPAELIAAAEAEVPAPELVGAVAMVSA